MLTNPLKKELQSLRLRRLSCSLSGYC